MAARIERQRRMRLKPGNAAADDDSSCLVSSGLRRKGLDDSMDELADDRRADRAAAPTERSSRLRQLVPWRRSVRLRLTVYVAALVFCTGLILAAGGVLSVRSLLLRDVRTHLVRDVETRSELLRSYIDQQRERAALIASRTRLRALIGQRLDDAIDDGSFRRETAVILRDAAASIEELETVLVLDREGIVITATDDAWIGRSMSRCVEHSTRRPDEHMMAPISEGERCRLYVTAAMRGNDDRPLGRVLVVLDGSPMQAMLHTGNGALDSFRSALVAGDETGHRALLPARTSTGMTFDNLLANEALMRTIVDGSGFLTVTDEEGQAALAAISPIGYADWSLLSCVDAAEVYQPIARVRNVSMAAIGLLLLAAVGGTRLVVARFTSPLTTLSRNAAAITAGRRDVRSGIERNDEIGLLAAAFDRMVTEVARHESDLEREIEARGRRLADEITERERIEREHDHIQSAVEALSQVIVVIGHELRTPLASLRVTTELLAEGGTKLDKEVEPFLGEIHRQVVEMAGLVNDMLELAQLRAGSMEWDWSRISINELVSEAIESARPQLRSERVELSETVEPELWINGDAAAIGRMLGHLLSNALRHTGTGDVHVRASAFDRAGARWLRLVVDDSGEGMTKEIARHAGEAFALSSGLLDEEHVHGRGFGLAICKGIAAAHGGTVQIDSTPGSGTAVTVDLQAELAQPVPSESSDQPTGHGDEGPSRVAGRALPIAARG